MENNNKIKHIYFFANPFGYGPTATLISIIHCFVGTKDVELHAVCKGLCCELLKGIPEIEIIQADQRDETIIENILSKARNPYVISSLNRFAINVASRLNIPCCFVDTLTYLWHEIPKDYLKADIYFAVGLPGVAEKISTFKNAICIPMIVDTSDVIDANQSERFSCILIQLGGMSSPTQTSVVENYLHILAYTLNNIDKTVYVTGGHSALKHLQEMVSNKLVHFIGASKQQFLELLMQSKLLLTAPGLHACTEAFYRGVPTNFLMPTNLSQWTNYSIFAKFNATGVDMTWENITGKPLPLKNCDEEMAIKVINHIAEQVLNNKKMLNKTNELFKQSISCLPDVQIQQQFLTQFGTTGAKKIYNIIQKEWRIGC